MNDHADHHHDRHDRHDLYVHDHHHHDHLKYIIRIILTQSFVQTSITVYVMKLLTLPEGASAVFVNFGIKLIVISLFTQNNTCIAVLQW